MTRPLDAPPDRLGDEGSGTVNSLGLIALAITLSLLLAGVGAARTAAVRLQAVADLAALAGAERSATSPWEDVGAAPGSVCRDSRESTRRSGTVKNSQETIRCVQCFPQVRTLH